MATPPGLRLNTITYPRGTVTAPRGLLEYLFGNLSASLRWEAPGSAVNPETGRRRRIYGTRQRSSARAGERMTLVLDNGETYGVSVTGTHIDFISFVLGRVQPGKVANIYSERGTEYGPQARGNTV